MKNIFLTTFGQTKNDLQTMLKNSRNLTDSFELRFDLCGDWKNKEKSLREIFPANSQVIFTNRDKLSDPAKFLPENDFELIDLDLNNLAWQPKLKIPAEKLVLSAHLFDEFSAEKTQETIELLQQNPAKFHKLAVWLDTEADWENLQKITANLPPERWILAGMGAQGTKARLFFAEKGFGTFACLPDQAVVDGQIDLATIYQHLQ